jgi:hypothetical protein
VVLNQVLVRFRVEGRDGGDLLAGVLRGVRDEGVCWLGGTRWRGEAAMRVSVSNGSTDATDIERSVESVLRALDRAAGTGGGG